MPDYRKGYNALKELNAFQEELLQERNAEIEHLKANCDRLRKNNEEQERAWKELAKMYDILYEKHEKLKESVEYEESKGE